MANTSKNLEWFIYASNKPMIKFGEVALGGPGAGNFIDGNASTTGMTLYAVALTKIGSGSPNETSTPIVLSIAGKDDSATPVTITGAATIPANSQLGAGVIVTVTGDKKFTDVTGITITSGGLWRDFIGVYSIPNNTDFEYLTWVDSLKWPSPASFEAVPRGYEAVDHYKRIRGEKTLDLGEPKYTAYNEGVLKYAGTDITLKAHVLEDGIPPAKETYLFGQVRFNAGLNVADVVTTPVTDGKYGVIIQLAGQV